MGTKKPKFVFPKVGANSVEELYLSVGIALSYWEETQDQLISLFRTFALPTNLFAFEGFIESSRTVRSKQLKRMLSLQKSITTESERNTISEVLKNLDQLAATRNEIAHGFCVEYSATVDDEETMSGIYLLPSLNSGIRIAPSLKYAHTPESIVDFTKAVITHRNKILDINSAIMVREQDLHAELPEESRTIIDFANQLSRGEIDLRRISDVLKLTE